MDHSTRLHSDTAKVARHMALLSSNMFHFISNLRPIILEANEIPTRMMNAPRKIDAESNLLTRVTKVVVIGDAGADTTSVGLALGKLGYNVYGMRKAVENIERDAPLWIEAAKAKHGNPEKIEPYGQDEFDKLTGQCDAIAGFPAQLFSDDLVKSFRRAKIIRVNAENHAAIEKNSVTENKATTENHAATENHATIENNAAPGNKTLFWKLRYAFTKVVGYFNPQMRFIKMFMTTVGSNAVSAKNHASPENKTLFWKLQYAFTKVFGYFDPQMRLINMFMSTVGNNAHPDANLNFVPESQILEINGTPEWAPLCAFLKVAVPEQDFPSVTNEDEFLAATSVRRASLLAPVVKIASALASVLGLIVLPVTSGLVLRRLCGPRVALVGAITVFRAGVHTCVALSRRCSVSPPAETPAPETVMAAAPVIVPVVPSTPRSLPPNKRGYTKTPAAPIVSGGEGTPSPAPHVTASSQSSVSSESGSTGSSARTQSTAPTSVATKGSAGGSTTTAAAANVSRPDSRRWNARRGRNSRREQPGTQTPRSVRSDNKHPAAPTPPHHAPSSASARPRDSPLATATTALSSRPSMPPTRPVLAGAWANFESDLASQDARSNANRDAEREEQRRNPPVLQLKERVGRRDQAGQKTVEERDAAVPLGCL